MVIALKCPQGVKYSFVEYSLNSKKGLNDQYLRYHGFFDNLGRRDL